MSARKYHSMVFDIPKEYRSQDGSHKGNKNMKYLYGIWGLRAGGRGT
jgi:hypothetical protein